MTAKDVATALRQVATAERAVNNAWFFKTEPGQYGYGDKFVGVTVPQQRRIAKQFKHLTLSETEKLVTSQWHEERLTGLFILVGQFERGTVAEQADIYRFYMQHTSSINNWDLVDSSAPKIVGAWLEGKPDKMSVLEQLAHSDDLWEKRIAMVATLWFISRGSAGEVLAIAEILVNDSHDLIQKAVGWMLRELGKQVDRQLLLGFLDRHAATMPRTALRYAIEHLPPDQKQHYMAQKAQLKHN